MTAPLPAWRSSLDKALIGVFLTVILAPSIDQLVRPDAAREPFRELRKAAPRPSLSFSPSALNRFPERYQAYYDDTFGLRDKFLRWNAIEKLDLLHVSPSRSIDLGRDGWLFYTCGHSVEVWRGLAPFDAGGLEAWRRMLEENRDRLKKRGIEYVFVIGPNKESIYPENVDPRFNRVGPTRMDQLVEYLDSHSDFRILDLRPALFEAKREDRPGDYLYFRDGTHWDARGALVAYRELAARLSKELPSLKPLDPGRLERVGDLGSSDSWANRMYVYDRRPQEARSWVIRPRPNARTMVETGPYAPSRVLVKEQDAPGLPRVLLVHDSFGPSIEALLAESVRRLACHWGFTVGKPEIESEKPDAVVQLFVERGLVDWDPDLLRLRLPDTDAQRFARSDEVLFVLDPAADPPQLSAADEAICRRAPGLEPPAVEIGVRTVKDMALVPELARRGGVVAFVDVTAPTDTTLLLFYQLDPADPYVRGRSVSVPLVAGRNRVYVGVDETGIRGRLGLRPGAAKGAYLVHALEIRSLAQR